MEEREGFDSLDGGDDIGTQVKIDEWVFEELDAFEETQPFWVHHSHLLYSWVVLTVGVGFQQLLNRWRCRAVWSYNIFGFFVLLFLCLLYYIILCLSQSIFSRYQHFFLYYTFKLLSLCYSWSFIRLRQG